MPEFQILVYTPVALADPAIAIAASRAGAVGILDLEYSRNLHSAWKAIGKLSRFAKGPWGVKADGRAADFVCQVAEKYSTNIDSVILTCLEGAPPTSLVNSLHRHNLKVLIEAKSWNEAVVAENAGADGLIAKGNESGGFVGSETAFVFLQRLLGKISLPVWIQGGIGLHSAAACRIAGACGVVLDSQLLLCRESALPDSAKMLISRMDGSETRCFGEQFDAAVRVYNGPALPCVKKLGGIEKDTLAKSIPLEEKKAQWCRQVRKMTGLNDPSKQLMPIGQDAVFAAQLAKRFVTTGGIIKAIRQSIEDHLKQAKNTKPFNEGNRLARSHATRYPIVQGPMSRVSDRAEFLSKVADAGALPFLALGFSGSVELGPIFEATRKMLADRPWGVGIIGFVPEKIQKQQMELIDRFRPPFALIAGGRPEQARLLEDKAISTYLHVPSPALLEMYLQNGIRRFIFEGRECGGHIGPRTSFILWNDAVDIITHSLGQKDLDDLHILFAGGIHDVLSSAMVAALAAPLAERGVKVGMILGTAYLFTEEAVATGAIVKQYQKQAIKCRHTWELETGPGHAVRCAVTPFAEAFRREKQAGLSRNISPDEAREILEKLNLGRLRIAAKGITRNAKQPAESGAPSYVHLAEEEQYEQGNYMMGQLATLKNKVLTIAELHRQVSVEGTHYLVDKADACLTPAVGQPGQKPSDIAIIGMACMLPGAPNLETYWQNILSKVNSVTEIPPDRWNSEAYFDEDPKSRDKIYSKWGGFLDPVAFNPLKYGIPPKSLTSIEPQQLLTLEVVDAALSDAGYKKRPFDKERTAVIWGAGGGLSDLGQLYAFRSNLPQFFNSLPDDLMHSLPEWTEDSFPGILTNVTTGRVANCFDLGGINCTVDAACASSLAALYQAVAELENRTSDMAIVGGSDTAQSPFAYLCFSKTRALSPSGRCRVFDQSADGTVISEGVAALVLKRLAAAERDGDRIYAVIKAVGASSDGSDKSLTAPKPEGQMRALERAYSKAGFSPATVDLIEAHGTGTVAGDQAEIRSLKTIFEKHGAEQSSCALGSVKSMIGHTKCTAGIAGVIKTALALHHKVLPATLGVENPNSSLASSPFYVNTATRPWMGTAQVQPRRAGVSAFGFGGTNFHAVLEEYTHHFLKTYQEPVARPWPAQLFVFKGGSRAEIGRQIAQVLSEPIPDDPAKLADLATTLWERAESGAGLAASVIADSPRDLKTKLARLEKEIQRASQADSLQIWDPKGIYYTETPLARPGKLAFVFPGQGSQYVGMLNDYATNFSEVRKQYELAEDVLKEHYEKLLSDYIYPAPSFDPDDEKRNQEVLTRTNITQPAVGASDMGLFHLMQAFGIRPAMVAGHSYGEFVALCAAGVFDEKTLYRLSEKRGRLMLESSDQDLGTMAAVNARPEQIEKCLQAVENVWVANLNSPEQTIISGSSSGVQQAVDHLKADGIKSIPIQVSAAFHSPLMAAAQKQFAKYLETIEFQEPQLEVYSNTHANPFPKKIEKLVSILGRQLISPVRWAEQIDAMYRNGARIFLEVGPRNILSNLIRQILDKQPHLTLALDAKGKSNLFQLLHVFGQLTAHAVQLKAQRIFHKSTPGQLNISAAGTEAQPRSDQSTTWIIKHGHILPPDAKDRDKKSAIQADEPMAETKMNNAAPISNAMQHNDTSPKIGKGKVARTTPSAMEDAAAHGDQIDQVMLRFQDLMNRFMEVQQQVMLAYLNGEPIPGDIPADLQQFESAAEHLADGGSAPTEIDEQTPAETKDSAPINQEAHDQQDQDSADQDDRLESSIPPENGTTPQDKEALTAKVLQVVSDRTGYPPDMLDLDLNMEADLGIDSIKRVEILGTLQQMFLMSNDQNDGDDQMKHVADIKTLRDLSDWLNRQLEVNQGVRGEPTIKQQQSNTSVSTEIDPAQQSDIQIPRFRVISLEKPIQGQKPLELSKDAVILITDDGQGIARNLADKLHDHDGNVAVVSMGAGIKETARGVYTADLEDAGSVDALIDLVRRQQGNITGIIHLLTLSKGPSFKDLSFKAWKRRAAREVKSLYLLARAAGKDLRKIAQSGNETAWLVAATTMGGNFGFDLRQQEIHNPWQGGISGFVKTAFWEWPEVICKVIDFSPGENADFVTECIIKEMGAQDGEVEIGYQNNKRMVLRIEKAPLEIDKQHNLAVESDWVVVATGGARGITAEIVLELAKRYRPTILLAGRTAQPPENEDPDTARIESEKELKKALINRYQQSGEKKPLVEIELEFKNLLKQREIRNTVEKIARAGSRVKYFQVDVADETTCGQFIDSIYDSYGRIDLFLHGAGIIADKLIEDKTPDSFNRVFDTKADSAFIISRKVDGESLKGMVFFSSISGRFGNKGQSDYAAANEVLNKLAVSLDQRWPGRIVAVNWGPWAKAGMVSAELQRTFKDSGVRPIAPPAGREALDKELLYGQKGQVEVIIGSGPWEAGNNSRSIVTHEELPLLQGTFLETAKNGDLKVIRKLDPSFDRYLQDHRLDGKPVFPAAMAAELMVEVVQKGWPDWEVIGINDFKVYKGIVLENGSREIQAIAKPKANSLEEDSYLEVSIEISDLQHTAQSSYGATVILGKSFPTEHQSDFELLPGLQPFLMTVDEAYKHWLFHGPAFQGITKVEGINDKGIFAVLKPSAPTQCLGGKAQGRWLIDPVLLDSAFQLAILWQRFQFDMTPLPSGFMEYRRFHSSLRFPVRCWLQAKASAKGHILSTSMHFYDNDNHTVASLDRMEFSCTKELNRLSATAELPGGAG